MSLTFPIERIGWVLFHFTWQAAVLALILGIALRWMRRSSSLLRYISACAILVLMALAPIVTFLLLPGNHPLDGRPLAVPDAALRNLPSWYHVQLPPTVVVEGTQKERLVDRIENWLQPKMPWVVALWCAGTALMLTRHIGAWIYLQKLLRRSSIPIRESWTRLTDLSERMGLRRRVLLLESTVLNVPATVGWMRPIVLLPASVVTGLSMPELEALVLHELAHIRRHDYLINVLQTVVETLLFYHPAVWWVSKQIRLERENCCDDIAAAASADPATYATALTTIETFRPDSTRFALGAGGGSLLDRIKRLTLPREITVRRRHGTVVVSSLLVTSLLLLIQAQSLASMMLQHRLRTLEEMPTFGQAVYSMLDMPRENSDLLPALEQVFSRLDKNDFADVDSPEVKHLVEVLNRGGDPDALMKSAAGSISAANKSAYQAQPSWSFGSYLQRSLLARGLWKEAEQTYPSSPQRARMYARAAMLLAGQEIMDYGCATLGAILHEDAGRNIAQLSKSQIEQFNRYLSDDSALSRLANGHAGRFTEWRTELKTVSAEQREPVVKAMIDSLGRLRALAPQRLRVQWQVANLMQQAAHDPLVKESALDLASTAQHWAREVKSPWFTEWMRQAIEEQPAKNGGGGTIKIITSEQLERQLSRGQNGRRKMSRVEEGGGEPSSGSTLDKN